VPAEEEEEDEHKHTHTPPAAEPTPELPDEIVLEILPTPHQRTMVGHGESLVQITV